MLLAPGCDGGKQKVRPAPPPHESFLALDREQQRLVRDYQPVSDSLIGYELSFRDWRLGRLSDAALAARAERYRAVVVAVLRRLVRAPVSGETVRGKRLFVAALRARARALRAPPAGRAYRREWDRSLARARAGLTVLQDIRDRARLIPLPEDAVS